MKKFSDLLREKFDEQAFREKGNEWTLSKLAKAAGISINHLQKILSGDSKPNIELGLLLVRLLDVDKEALFQLVEGPSSKGHRETS